VRSTHRLIATRFCWPQMAKAKTLMARACMFCQRGKIHKHVHLQPPEIPVPHRRFAHIHVNLVGPLPPSCSHTYLFTIIDRTSRWPEAVPLPSITAADCPRALFAGWVSIFGVPATITFFKFSPAEAVFGSQLILPGQLVNTAESLSPSFLKDLQTAMTGRPPPRRGCPVAQVPPVRAPPPSQRGWLRQMTFSFPPHRHRHRFDINNHVSVRPPASQRLAAERTQPLSLPPQSLGGTCGGVLSVPAAFPALTVT
jgi:hypothetical protein